MTKTEFKKEAAIAGIPSELYGAVLAGQFKSDIGYVTGGKVIGIEWRDDRTGKVPYIILLKDGEQHLVGAWHITVYLNKQFNKWLGEKVKAKETV